MDEAADLESLWVELQQQNAAPQPQTQAHMTNPGSAPEAQEVYYFFRDGKKGEYFVTNSLACLAPNEPGSVLERQSIAAVAPSTFLDTLFPLPFKPDPPPPPVVPQQPVFQVESTPATGDLSSGAEPVSLEMLLGYLSQGKTGVSAADSTPSPEPIYGGATLMSTEPNFLENFCGADTNLSALMQDRSTDVAEVDSLYSSLKQVGFVTSPIKQPTQPTGGETLLNTVPPVITVPQTDHNANIDCSVQLQPKESTPKKKRRSKKNSKNTTEVVTLTEVKKGPCKRKPRKTKNANFREILDGLDQDNDTGAVKKLKVTKKKADTVKKRRKGGEDDIVRADGPDQLTDEEEEEPLQTACVCPVRGRCRIQPYRTAMHYRQSARSNYVLPEGHRLISFGSIQLNAFLKKNVAYVSSAELLQSGIIITHARRLTRVIRSLNIKTVLASDEEMDALKALQAIAWQTKNNELIPCTRIKALARHLYKNLGLGGKELSTIANAPVCIFKSNSTEPDSCAEACKTETSKTRDQQELPLLGVTLKLPDSRYLKSYDADTVDLDLALPPVIKQKVSHHCSCCKHRDPEPTGKNKKAPKAAKAKPVLKANKPLPSGKFRVNDSTVMHNFLNMLGIDGSSGVTAVVSFPKSGQDAANGDKDNIEVHKISPDSTSLGHEPDTQPDKDILQTTVDAVFGSKQLEDENSEAKDGCSNQLNTAEPTDAQADKSYSVFPTQPLKPDEVSSFVLGSLSLPNPSRDQPSSTYTRQLQSKEIVPSAKQQPLEASLPAQTTTVPDMGRPCPTCMCNQLIPLKPESGTRQSFTPPFGVHSERADISSPASPDPVSQTPPSYPPTSQQDNTLYTRPVNTPERHTNNPSARFVHPEPVSSSILSGHPSYLPALIQNSSPCSVTERMCVTQGPSAESTDYHGPLSGNDVETGPNPVNNISLGSGTRPLIDCSGRPKPGPPSDSNTGTGPVSNGTMGPGPLSNSTTDNELVSNSTVGPGPQSNCITETVPLSESSEGPGPLGNSTVGPGPLSNSTRGTEPLCNNTVGPGPLSNSNTGTGPLMNSSVGSEGSPMSPLKMSPVSSSTSIAVETELPEDSSTIEANQENSFANLEDALISAAATATTRSLATGASAHSNTTILGSAVSPKHLPFTSPKHLPFTSPTRADTSGSEYTSSTSLARIIGSSGSGVEPQSANQSALSSDTPSKKRKHSETEAVSGGFCTQPASPVSATTRGVHKEAELDHPCEDMCPQIPKIDKVVSLSDFCPLPDSLSCEDNLEDEWDGIPTTTSAANLKETVSDRSSYFRKTTSSTKGRPKRRSVSRTRASKAAPVVADATPSLEDGEKTGATEPSGPSNAAIEKMWKPYLPKVVVGGNGSIQLNMVLKKTPNNRPMLENQDKLKYLCYVFAQMVAREVKAGHIKYVEPDSGKQAGGEPGASGSKGKGHSTPGTSWWSLQAQKAAHGLCDVRVALAENKLIKHMQEYNLSSIRLPPGDPAEGADTAPVHPLLPPDTEDLNILCSPGYPGTTCTSPQPLQTSKSSHPQAGRIRLITPASPALDSCRITSMPPPDRVSSPPQQQQQLTPGSPEQQILSPVADVQRNPEMSRPGLKQTDVKSLQKQADPKPGRKEPLQKQVDPKRGQEQSLQKQALPKPGRKQLLQKQAHPKPGRELSLEKQAHPKPGRELSLETQTHPKPQLNPNTSPNVQQDTVNNGVVHQETDLTTNSKIVSGTGKKATSVGRKRRSKPTAAGTKEKRLLLTREVQSARVDSSSDTGVKEEPSSPVCEETPPPVGVRLQPATQSLPTALDSSVVWSSDWRGPVHVVTSELGAHAKELSPFLEFSQNFVKQEDVPPPVVPKKRGRPKKANRKAHPIKDVRPGPHVHV